MTGIKIKFLLILANFFNTSTAGIRPLPGLPNVFYRRDGDLNIGVVIPVHRYDSYRHCSLDIREIGALQRVEAVAFAVAEINNRDDILPNITLGFTMMDDCSKDTTALARGLHFIQTRSNDEKNDQLPAIDVIGVIGSESSKNTVQLADLLSLFEIPILSYLSTSPLLSNKFVYPFFSRIVPSDTLQAKVIGDILKQFGWTYVSIIYAEGSYGSEGYKAVKARLEDIGYCLAVVREMRQSFRNKDYEDIIKELKKKRRARVVVIYAPLAQTRELLKSALRVNAFGQFTWIGSDAWGRNIQDYDGLEDVALGALTVKFLSSATPRFDEYFKHLTLSNSSRNPWFKTMVATEIGCSFESSSKKSQCPMNYSFGSSEIYKPETTVSLVIDAVYTFARALHPFSECLSNHNLRNCLSASEYVQAIRNVSFEGENGIISFDMEGNGKATYEIQNLQRSKNDEYRLASVALWDSYKETFTRFDTDKIMWKPSVLGDTETAPKSTCSDSCPLGYQAIRTMPHCCWYCEKCRNNEKTVIQEGLPHCEICPTVNNFTWPDSKTKTRCLAINPTYTSVNDFTGIVIIAVDIFTIIVALMVTILFLKNNKERLIKGNHEI